MSTEANARLVINASLIVAGWQLVDTATTKANVYAEAKSESGFADYLLFDSQGFPIAVIEAKAPHIDPLAGKEQARGYARDHNARFVFLSNGATSYSWDIVEGNPEKMSKWPSPDELEQKSQQRDNPGSTKEVDPVQARLLLANEPVGEDYIARSQKSGYDQNASWVNPSLRAAYIEESKLRFLRPYQINALTAVQGAVKLGKYSGPHCQHINLALSKIA
jgi:type I restriction enzyme R subunit